MLSLTACAYQTRQRPLRVAEVGTGATTRGLGALRVTEPTTETFRVVQRAGSFCADLPAERTSIKLTMEAPRDDSLGGYGETFEWVLQ